MIFGQEKHVLQSIVRRRHVIALQNRAIEGRARVVS
jgi:hypothetical protein